jgi:hypothetical protein
MGLLGQPAANQTYGSQSILADQLGKPKFNKQNSPASSVGEFRANQETALILS